MKRVWLTLMLIAIGCAGDPAQEAAQEQNKYVPKEDGLSEVNGLMQDSRTAGNFINNGSRVWFASLSEDEIRYHVQFQIQTGGSFSLVSHCNEREERGLEVRFTNEGARTFVEAFLNGASVSNKVEVDGVESQLDLANLYVEVHNDHGHILLFDMQNNEILEIEADGAVSGAGSRASVKFSNAKGGIKNTLEAKGH